MPNTKMSYGEIHRTVNMYSEYHDAKTNCQLQNLKIFKSA